jgi:hypothetical protein
MIAPESPKVGRPKGSPKTGGRKAGTPNKATFLLREKLTGDALNHFYDLVIAASTRTNWQVFHYRTADGGYVASDELAALRAEMDPKRYAQEFDASFETLQSRVYHAFDRERNVIDRELSGYAPLLIGMDFNISPMTAVIGQKLGDKCQILDEIVLMNSNTQEMMQAINQKYGGCEGIVHPDPSCVARRTSAPVGQTDFTIIERAGWPVYTVRAPYPLVDRINTVNSMLCNAQGVRRLLIAPQCTDLIKALDGLTYKERSKIPDGRSGLGHITDALGYLIMGVFPMIPRGRGACIRNCYRCASHQQRSKATTGCRIYFYLL